MAGRHSPVALPPIPDHFDGEVRRLQLQRKESSKRAALDDELKDWRRQRAYDASVSETQRPGLGRSHLDQPEISSVVSSSSSHSIARRHVRKSRAFCGTPAMNHSADALARLGTMRECAVRPSRCRRRHITVGSL